MSDTLTVGEEAIMRETWKRTMLRAAELLDRITDDDVTEAQAQLLADTGGAC